MSGTEFDWSARPNRSLTLRGRKLWLLLVGVHALVVCAFALAVGAWPVLPFAGLEVFCLALAFWWIGRADEDVEEFSVRGRSFVWRQRRGECVETLSGNLDWAQVSWKRCESGMRLQIRYAGRAVVLGRCCGSEASLRIAELLRGVNVYVAESSQHRNIRHRATAAGLLHRGKADL
jgi:uncharacterized membrane protein